MKIDPRPILKFSGPRALLHLEGLVVLSGACIFYGEGGNHWSRFLLLFLLPDLLMVGYLWGTKVGAIAYNSGHSYIAPFSLGLVAHLGRSPGLLSLALIWCAHIGFDRLLGYGLKYDAAFTDTHFGRV